MKKILAVGMVIFLFWLCFIPGSTQSISTSINGNTITVDDEGDGDYTSIKEALAYVNSGATIEVYSGTYYEYNITVKKPDITLKGIPYELGNGSDSGKPFINGQGIDIVIEILFAEGITITGFRIENGGGTTAHAIIGFYESDNCLISENDLSHATCSGIFGDKSNNARIVNNNISDSGIRAGIGFHEGKNNTISDNIITDIGFNGIYIWDSDYNTITSNRIRRCADSGIRLLGDYNVVSRNYIKNSRVGLENIGQYNVIEKNNFVNNARHASFDGLFNKWSGNYWGRPRILPYPVFGTVSIFPWINIDWRPALRPYEI